MYLNKADTKELLWNYSFDKERRVVQGFYYSWGHDVKAYSDIMEEGMNEAIRSLDKRLREIPLEKLKRK